MKRGRLFLALYLAAIALSIAVGGCASAYDCERHGIGFNCYRVKYVPEGQ